jgi:tetratricopeptide (TPR) repeat protein
VPALLSLIEREPPHPEFVALLRALAFDALAVRQPSDWGEALHHCQAATVMAERLAAPVAVASALFACAAVYGAQGMLRERREVALRALAISRDPQFDDVHERIYGLASAGSALISLGDYLGAIPYITEAEQLADQARAIDLQNRTLSLLVYCWYRLDRWEEMLAAESRRRELQRIYQLERLGAPCFSIGLTGAVHGLQGDVERATSLQVESAEIMTLVAGPPERWGRTHRY